MWAAVALLAATGAPAQAAPGVTYIDYSDTGFGVKCVQFALIQVHRYPGPIDGI